MLMTKESIAKEITDDGLFVDHGWDKRHSQNASRFNEQNHHHYKEYFDKPFKAPQRVAHTPFKTLDPYVENEVKDTRMPDYSIVSRTRDVFGEFGWIPNFGVSKSKNNDRVHTQFKEFFDTPQDYKHEFTTTFQASIDAKSIDNRPESIEALVRSKKSLNQIDRMSYSALRTTKQRPGIFQLKKDQSNKYKYDQKLGLDNSIPFLRQVVIRQSSYSGNYFKRRERGFDNVQKPISRFNEKVHLSKKLKFEQI